MELNYRSVSYALGAIVLATLLVLVGIIAFPGLVDGDDAYIVTSGSMSPTLEPGDVIVTQDVSPEGIETGDVVTVHDGDEADTGYVTHRVVDVVEEDGELFFQLQGDANDDPDEGLVPAEYVQGERHVTLPYIGHLLLFARSPLGLFAFVILPGLFLVASGSWQLLRELGYAPDGGRVPASTAGADEPASNDRDFSKGDPTLEDPEAEGET